MEILHIIFRVFTFMMALLGLGIAIYGTYVMFNVSTITRTRQPPVFKPIGIRVLSGTLIVSGLEMLFINARFLFNESRIEMDFLATAASFLLFFILMGTATIFERPFLAANLIPKLASRRILLGVSFIIYGLLWFFKLSEDYWPVAENIQDLIFWAFFFISLSSPVLISRLHRQAN